MSCQHAMIIACLLLNAMRRTKMLRVLLSDKEFEKLKEYAHDNDQKVPEVIRDYIKRLPKTKILN